MNTYNFVGCRSRKKTNNESRRWRSTDGFFRPKRRDWSSTLCIQVPHYDRSWPRETRGRWTDQNRNTAPTTAALCCFCRATRTCRAAAAVRTWYIVILYISCAFCSSVLVRIYIYLARRRYTYVLTPRTTAVVTRWYSGTSTDLSCCYY